MNAAKIDLADVLPWKWKCWPIICVWLFAAPWTIACQAPLSMEFSSKDTEVGRHFILQGIFPTQGLNQGFMHYGQILYHLSHQGSYIALNVCVYYKNREPKN